MMGKYVTLNIDVIYDSHQYSPQKSELYEP